MYYENTMCNVFNNLKNVLFIKDTKLILQFQIFFKLFFVSDTEYLSLPMSSEPTLQRYETFFVFPNNFTIIF